MTGEITVQKIQNVIGYDSTEDKPKGFSFTAKAGELTIYHYKIKQEGLRFQGGEVDCTDHEKRDCIDVRLVDKDGKYYPPYTVMRDYVEKVPLKKDGTQQVKSLSFSQPMPKDIYVELKYYSFGIQDVFVACKLDLHKTEDV